MSSMWDPPGARFSQSAAFGHMVRMMVRLTAAGLGSHVMLGVGAQLDAEAVWALRLSAASDTNCLMKMMMMNSVH